MTVDLQRHPIRSSMAGQAFMLLTAAMCAILAALANPLVLGPVVSQTGVLPSPLDAALWVWDAALITVAFVLVRLRHDARAAAGLGVGLVSVVLCLGLVEGVLRLLDYRPGAIPLYAVGPPGTGTFRLKPNLDLTTWFGGRQVTIRTNSHGMRWREVRPEHSGGSSRIAFLGDSFTFGLWAASVEQSFVGVVDRLLRADGFEALNFGVPGYGLSDSDQLLRDEVVRFLPRYVVLTFYNGNDFLDTYLGPGRYRVSRSGFLDTDWALVERKVPAEFRNGAARAAGAWWQSLSVYQLARYAAKTLWPHAAEAMTGRDPRREAGTRGASYASDVFWSREVYPDFAVAARQVSLAALGRIEDFCARRGIRFAVVTIPSLEQVMLQDAPEDGYDVRLPQRYLEEFARARGVPYLDLLPVLRAHADRDVPLYYRHDGHLRDEGHRIIGEELAAFLRRNASRFPSDSASVARRPG